MSADSGYGGGIGSAAGAIGSQAAQSVPPIRRTSGADDAFGMDRLSLGGTNGAGKDGVAEDDAVYAEGAQSEWPVSSIALILALSPHVYRVRPVSPAQH